MNERTDHGLKDGGSRTTFDTGAVREVPAGRGRWDLIPYEPMMRLAQHYERGAIKYAARNWQKGLPLTNFLNSMSRHVFLLMSGDTQEDHAAAIAWNVFGYMWTEERIRLGLLPNSLDDIDPVPEYRTPNLDANQVERINLALDAITNMNRTHSEAVRSKLRPTNHIDIEPNKEKDNG